MMPSDAKTQKAIVVILRYGSLIAMLTMAVGLVWSFFRGLTPTTPGDRAVQAGSVLRALAHHDPSAPAALGILLLLLTPTVRIAAAAVGFALEREYRYVLISLGVLMIVMLSIGLAVAG